MQYRLGIHCPQITIAEQNLGHLVGNELHVSQQHALAAKNRLTALRVLLAKGQSAAEGKSLVPLFVYSVQFWAPHHKKDTDILKQVQWSAAKILGGWSS